MEGEVVVVEESLEVVCKGVNIDIKSINQRFVVFQSLEWRMVGKVFPQDVNYGARIYGRGGDLNKREGELENGAYNKINSKDRETVTVRATCHELAFFMFFSLLILTLMFIIFLQDLILSPKLHLLSISPSHFVADHQENEEHSVLKSQHN